MGKGVLRVRSALTGVAIVLAMAAAAFAGDPLTNEIIIKMVKAGVPTETIVRTIQSAESFHFGTLPGDLQQLQDAKVPDEIIRALAARINWPGSSWRMVVPVQITPSPTSATPEKPAKPEKRAKPQKINASAKRSNVPLVAALGPVTPVATQQRPGKFQVVLHTIWNTCTSAVRGIAHIF